jgi:hypothetical protein
MEKIVLLYHLLVSYIIKAKRQNVEKTKYAKGWRAKCAK